MQSEVDPMPQIGEFVLLGCRLSDSPPRPDEWLLGSVLWADGAEGDLLVEWACDGARELVRAQDVVFAAPDRGAALAYQAEARWAIADADGAVREAEREVEAALRQRARLLARFNERTGQTT